MGFIILYDTILCYNILHRFIVQSLLCILCCAIFAVRSLLCICLFLKMLAIQKCFQYENVCMCNLCCAICVVHSLLCILCCAIFVVQNVPIPKHVVNPNIFRFLKNEKNTKKKHWKMVP